MDPRLLDQWNAAGEGAALSLLLAGSDPVSLELPGLTIQDVDSPRSLLWFLLAPGAEETPPPLKGLDDERPWVLALGDGGLGRASAAFFSGLPVGPELSEGCVRHRFVLPAADSEALQAALSTWVKSSERGKGRWSAHLERGEAWVRLELLQGRRCVWGAENEDGPRGLDLLRKGRGALERPRRLRELRVLTGLALLRLEAAGVSPEERMPLAFRRHAALLSEWLEGASPKGGAGQTCLENFVKGLVKAPPDRRGEDASWARDELDCMDADPVTRELAGEIRWLRLRYRAKRLVLLGRRDEGLALLKGACDRAMAPACAVALDWHGRPEPELARSAEGLGQAQLAYGLQRRVLLDRAGRLTGDGGLKGSEGFQLWIDARAGWEGLGGILETLAGLGRVPRVKVALRDAAGELRLLSVWLDEKPPRRSEGLGGLARLGQGRKQGRARTRVTLELEGMALGILGPGGRLHLPAPEGCTRLDCWNLEGLKKLLQDHRIARLDPLFLLRASGKSRWEQVAALISLLGELGSEVLVDPHAL